MDYKATHLTRVFTVNEIFTVHYFEYEKNYSFTGESHDFWELVYVDKGEIEIEMGQEKRTLRQGFTAFHQPNEYHNLRANGIVAPNLVVISFCCDSPAMDFFKKRILPLSDIEKHLLATIVRESMHSFSSPLDNTFLNELERRDEVFFGSEQMIAHSLEHLLISLYRNFDNTHKNSSTVSLGIEQNLLYSVLCYLQEHVCEKLTFERIAKDVGASPTTLKTLFRENVGQGIMSYFSQMKMEIAKSMIREGNYNISQIAAHLGYDTVHLFSRRFRQMTGMSPTEYSRSVKVVFESGENNFFISQ